MKKPVVHHIPVCPFSQRLEVLLALKGARDAVEFNVVDITVPRPQRLLELSRGSTALPILEAEDGTVLRESLVLMQYLEDRFPERPVAQRDATRRAIENMLTALASDFVGAGYRLVMNQDRARRESMHAIMLEQYALLDAFLVEHAAERTFLFEEFGWAEVVFTSMFQRFWFLEYYEDFVLPDEPRFARVRRWVEACRMHPSAQQVTREEIVKLYYDYAKGAGNGALVAGRTRSSFVFEPHWSKRPWPPREKYDISATDQQLGLLPR